MEEIVIEFKDHKEIIEIVSLRDYFAAKALTGMLAYSINNQYNQSNGTPEDIAQGAYKFADAMLLEREK